MEKFPTFEVAQIYNQQDNVVKVLEKSIPHYAMMLGRGEWTIADLVEFPECKLHRFAIWNRTGNVYKVDKHGAAEDDPFITVTEFD